MHICVCIQFIPPITSPPTPSVFLPHFSFLRSLCFQKQVLSESDVSVHGCGFIYLSMARLLESAALKISDLAACIAAIRCQ